MGEAKKRLIRQRESILRVLDQWAKPPSNAEQEALAAIQTLPIIRVQRAPRGQIAWMRMKERLCHDNCAWYEENDPTKGWKAVTGWIVDQATGNYVLHAVICSSSGEYRCITPIPHASIQWFDFIPDPSIVTTRDDRGHYHHVREGFALGVGLRPDPARTIAEAQAARDRIMAGEDPIKVLKSIGLN